MLRRTWVHGMHASASRRLAGAALLLATAAAATAEAQPQLAPVPAYSVAVTSDPGAGGAVMALRTAGFQALASTSPFVVDPNAMQGSPVEAQSQQEAALVTRTLDTGLQAMGNLELDSAVSAFSEVVSTFESNPGLTVTTGTDPLARALVNLGINSFLNGDESGTEAYFAYAVTVNPTILPDFDLFPDVADLYTRVVEEIGGRNTSAVDVQVIPEDAEVLIDGLSRGFGPQRIDLPPGKHLFTARANGYSAGGVIQEITRGRRNQTQTVQIALNPAPGSGGPPGAELLADALMEGSGREVGLFRSICDAVAARFLLVSWIMMGDGNTSMVSVQLYDRQMDRVVQAGLSPEVRLDAGSIAGAMQPTLMQCIVPVAQALYQAAIAPPPPPPIDNPPIDNPPIDDDTDGDDTPIYEEWWLWTIVGAVVVGGAAAGLAVGLQDTGTSGPDNPQIVIDF